MNGVRPPLPGPLDVKGGWFDMLDDYVALIESCWAQHPHDRPSFAQIIVELRWAGLACLRCCLQKPQLFLSLHAGGSGQTLQSLKTISRVRGALILGWGQGQDMLGADADDASQKRPFLHLAHAAAPMH